MGLYHLRLYSDSNVGVAAALFMVFKTIVYYKNQFNLTAFELCLPFCHV
jgi:hypothetical protein